MKKQLTLDDTNVLKGIAILLMLVHHLFYPQNGYFSDIHLYKDYYLVEQIGLFSKVCVSFFVFLSGYGLTQKYKSTGEISNLKGYYVHRFSKLYLNYWLVWILFVPISIYLYGYTFDDAYQSSIIPHVITDVLGLHKVIFVNTPCYNPSWWFYSCIIILYGIFPFLFKWARKSFFSLFFFTLAVSFIPIGYLNAISFFVISFVLGIGIAMSINDIEAQMTPWVGGALLTVFCLERNLNMYQNLVDAIIVLLFILLYSKLKIGRKISKILGFCGRHSMNIFLFHVFIIWWFKDFIYLSRNPIIIFLTLLALCVPISIGMEWVKKYTIYKL